MMTKKKLLLRCVVSGCALLFFGCADGPISDEELVDEVASELGSALALQGPTRIARDHFEWFDASRGRSVPVDATFPAKASSNTPVIVLSHGGFAAPHHYRYLADHLASHGYAVFAPEHVGSSTGQFDGVTDAEMAARAYDVSFVLDEATALNAGARGPHALQGRLSLAQVGVAGHSFGSATAMASGGALAPRDAPGDRSDARVAAIVAMSPQAPSPIRPYFPDGALAYIDVPGLLLTGTADGFGDVAPEDRLEAFELLSPGDKYLAVYSDANHFSFANIGALRYRRYTQGFVTAFFNVYVRGYSHQQGLLSATYARALSRAYGRRYPIDFSVK